MGVSVEFSKNYLKDSLEPMICLFETALVFPFYLSKICSLA